MAPDEEPGAVEEAAGEEVSEEVVEEVAEETESEIDGKALGCLAAESDFRRHCYSLFRNRVFQTVVLVLIVGNTVLLALQGPRHTLGAGFDNFVAWFDIVITGVFTVEMCAGICALGLVKGENAYLRNWWNVLDFVVVLGIYVSALAMLLFGADLEAGAVRAFRALRPLRSLRLFKGLQGILDALWLTLPYVSTVMGMLSFFLIIFSTMGVALFGGTLSRACRESTELFSTQPYLAAVAGDVSMVPTGCPPTMACAAMATDPQNTSQLVAWSVEGDDMCTAIPYDLDRTHLDRTFETKYIGYDNVLYSFLTLIVVTTLDEWPLIAHRMWQSDGNVGFGAWWFIVVVVLLVSLLTVNLFTAVVSYGFGKMRNELHRSAFTGEEVFGKGPTEEETGPVDDKETFVSERPFPFIPAISPAAYDLVRSNAFEYTILGAIVGNAICMASEYHGMSKGHKDALVLFEVGFLVVFLIEMLIKWSGMGMSAYFADRFNCFDCTLVVFGIMGFIADLALGGSSSGRVVRILFRMFRVARLLRLAGKDSTVGILLKTIFSSWSAIANLLVFISFTLVVFAIIGMHTFGYTCHGGELADAETPRTSFASFSDSLLACFQVMSGEDWAPIMYYYMHCSSPVGASIFFTSLTVSCGFVLVSMFVAVILENFALAEEQKARAQAEVLKSKVIQNLDNGSLEELPQWRWNCRSIAEKKWFERVVLVIIMASSVVMGLEYPTQQQLTADQQEWQDTLEKVGLCFFAGFCIEASIKLAAYGITKYLRDPWNRLDFLVVLMGALDLVVYVVSGSKSNVTNVLRLFRVLRPLRLIKRNEGMVVIVNALISCIPMVVGVVGLVALLYMVFAIIGMHMYMGMMFGCAEQPEANTTADLSMDSLSNATGDFDMSSLNEVDCLERGGAWEHVSYFSFDDIFKSFKTLFIVSTTEGWVTAMEAAMDTPSVMGDPPSENNSQLGATIYFSAFIIFGAFFSANLFVGILVSFFGQSSGNALLTEGQKQWVQLNMLAMQLAPDPIIPPEQPARRACYNISISHNTELFIGGAIIVNTLMLMLEAYPMDQGLADLMEVFNFFFLLIFTVESVIKMAGLGVRPYFSASAWNRLDFTIVAISWISMAAEGLSVFSGGRALRVFRLLLLLKNTESLRTLLRTLVLSLPPALNITLLLTLVLFVFGIIGMQLFGGLPLGNPLEDAINTYDNFDTLPAAVRVLFQIATGQDWVSKAEELEQKMLAADYVGQSLVLPYMVVFYISSVFIFINLFIAVLLENFELNFDPDAQEIKSADMAKFKAAWEQTVAPGQMQMPIKSVKRMVEKSDLGVLSQVMEDSQWWPHLLANIGWDTAKDPTDEDVVGFRKLLLSLALMFVTIDALPLAERIAEAKRLTARAELTASRLIHACIVAKLHLKRPEQYCDPDLRAKHATDPDFFKKYRHAVIFCRNMMVVQIVAVNKISAEHVRNNDEHLLELMALQNEAVRTCVQQFSLYRDCFCEQRASACSDSLPAYFVGWLQQVDGSKTGLDESSTRFENPMAGSGSDSDNNDSE